MLLVLFLALAAPGAFGQGGSAEVDLRDCVRNFSSNYIESSLTRLGNFTEAQRQEIRLYASRSANEIQHGIAEIGIDGVREFFETFRLSEELAKLLVVVNLNRLDFQKFVTDLERLQNQVYYQCLI